MTLKKSPTSKSSMVSSKSMAELSTKSNGSKSLQVDEDEKKNGKHKGNAHAGGVGNVPADLLVFGISFLHCHIAALHILSTFVLSCFTLCLLLLLLLRPRFWNPTAILHGNHTDLAVC
jgi:hypothetical protein